MKKVFQTIVDKDHGNCMQAVVASLFELELDDVPNFIEMESWGLVMSMTSSDVRFSASWFGFGS